MGHVPRIYVGGRVSPGALTLEGETAKRLSAVMRLREGDSFLVFSGDGREYEATVSGVTKKGVAASVGTVTRQEAELPLVLEVWCALVRPQRFDWAVEKLTETGADVIRPLLSEHSARGEGSSAARQERWGRISIEAAEQCGRLRLPVIEPPEPLVKLLERHHGCLLLADPDGRSWTEAVPLLPDDGRVAIAIGPEGGFSAEEVAAARARGAIALRLGPNILRTETAAVMAAGLVRSLGR